MSRTKRFKKDSFLIKEHGVLNTWVRGEGYNHFSLIKIAIDPQSSEAKKRLAQFHSDTKKHVRLSRGPGWFHNMYAQRPYRIFVKKELSKFLIDPDYEIQLRDKPYREYWD